MIRLTSVLTRHLIYGHHWAAQRPHRPPDDARSRFVCRRPKTGGAFLAAACLGSWCDNRRCRAGLAQTGVDVTTAADALRHPNTVGGHKTTDTSPYILLAPRLLGYQTLMVRV